MCHSDQARRVEESSQCADPLLPCAQDDKKKQSLRKQALFYMLN